MGSNWSRISCDQPATFFLQEQHSRYSVTMKYHPLMSKTFRTVLYSPHGLKWLPRRRQLGFVHCSLYAHMRQGIHRNSLLWKNGSGIGGSCEYNNWGPGGDHHSCRGSVSFNFPHTSLLKRALLTQRCCSFGSICFQPSGSKTCWRNQRNEVNMQLFLSFCKMASFDLLLQEDQEAFRLLVLPFVMRTGLSRRIRIKISY